MEADKIKKIRILIVDDDKDIRHALKRALIIKGYIVEEAENGQIGLNKAKQYFPDVIILDGKMPVMDGFEMYRALKNDENVANIPIIFCSATDIDELKKRNAKVAAYISKPFEINDIYRAIENIVNI